MGFKRPCLNCGVLVAQGNRCATHQTQYQATIDQRRKPNRQHYNSDYKRRAKQVRESAQTCWICKEGYKPNDPWTADHYHAGQVDSPLLPAHRSCNSRRGNNPPMASTGGG